MKKFFLFAAALCTAVSINAKVIDIGLESGVATEADLVIVEDEMTVSYDLGEWGAGGVVFALDDLDVTELAFDYKGDASVESWVSFLVYLQDSEGGMWYSQEADLSISSWNAEWESKNFMPADVLWESSAAAEPVKPFKALGFLANPASATKATFAIRNVKLTVADAVEAIENVESQAKAVKVVRDGQVLILRDGKTFNALGSEMK